MLIVIPTYKRMGTLRVVLDSLLSCSTVRIPEPVRVLVVNNYPPAKTEVAALIEEYSQHARFQWEALFRSKTLPPAQNWYDAILSEAMGNETVVISSDDDLFTPWSLELRYSEINQHNGDLLLADLSAPLYFFRNFQEVFLDGALPRYSQASAKIISAQEMRNFSPQHLSVHCYRNTKCFRRCVKLAFAWCDQQSWLNTDDRTLYLPLYLCLAIQTENGRVLGIRSVVSLRGKSLDEARQALYYTPNWNQSFASMCAIDLFRRISVLHARPEVGELIKVHTQEMIRWGATLLFDPRVKWSAIRKTFKEAKLTLRIFLNPHVIFGSLIVGERFLGLQGLRLVHRAKKGKLTASRLIDQMAAQIP